MASNSYEEARKQKVQENLKRIEDLGIKTISKSLLEVAKCEYKLLNPNASPKSEKKLEMLELRRSSRARNLVSSYRDDVVEDIDLRSYRKRYNRTTYGVRTASYEEHVSAVLKAEKLLSNLNSGNPSFVKSMVRSHVSGCFWLGLPSRFCRDFLPPHDLKMVLEDENGLEHGAIYIGSRTGLSGGWRGFSMDHKLDDGDALVFELCQPSRFKVYIIKAIEKSNPDNGDKTIDAEVGTVNSTNARKSSEDGDMPVTGKSQLRTGSARRVKGVPKRSLLQ